MKNKKFCILSILFLMLFVIGLVFLKDKKITIKIEEEKTVTVTTSPIFTETTKSSIISTPFNETSAFLETQSESATLKENSDIKYIVNINSKKFHSPDCSAVQRMAEHNKEIRNCDRQKLIDEGYKPCKICKP